MSGDEEQVYDDRRQAGAHLAGLLDRFRDRDDAIVLGLPRGGIPVASEVARALAAPLDIFLVRKLGLPGYPELAMGAIASGGIRVLNADVVAAYSIPGDVIDRIAREELAELERRERLYREGCANIDLSGRLVLLVDDGLATGATMKAAVAAVRRHHPVRVVVAVPVGSAKTCREFTKVADEIVCARAPEYFAAVGQWYRDFSQTTDEEVQSLLREHAEWIRREAGRGA